ncbi:MAG: DUF3710 domain-containing protein [Streptosporangiaceae bacterium]
MFRRRHRERGDQTGPAGSDAAAGLDMDAALADDDLADDDQPDDDQPDDDQPDDAAEYQQPGREPASPGRAGRSARPARDDLGDPVTWTRLRDSSDAAQARARSAGPWDSAGGFPDVERMDFGSLLVPARQDFDVQINLSEDTGVWIAVVHGDSGLQLQAFAAPKTSGIWDEVRQEIAEEVAKSGGESSESSGPFGPELLARVSPGADERGRQVTLPLRFMGVDGPRWFLRGLLSGPAAEQPELARPFEEIFADVVIVRGDHAEPPRKPLEIRLPDEARQALEEQMEASGQDLLNPFERGPEITETR